LIRGKTQSKITIPKAVRKTKNQVVPIPGPRLSVSIKDDHEVSSKLQKSLEKQMLAEAVVDLMEKKDEAAAALDNETQTQKDTETANKDAEVLRTKMIAEMKEAIEGDNVDDLVALRKTWELAEIEKHGELEAEAQKFRDQLDAQVYFYF